MWALSWLVYVGSVMAGVRGLGHGWLYVGSVMAGVCGLYRRSTCGHRFLCHWHAVT